jgi:hypothetical protein
MVTLMPVTKFRGETSGGSLHDRATPNFTLPYTLRSLQVGLTYGLDELLCKRSDKGLDGAIFTHTARGFKYEQPTDGTSRSMHEFTVDVTSIWHPIPTRFQFHTVSS